MAVALVLSVAVAYVFSLATDNLYYGNMPAYSGLYVYDSANRALVPADSVSWYDSHARVDADEQAAQLEEEPADADGDEGASASSSASSLEGAFGDRVISKLDAMGFEAPSGKVDAADEGAGGLVGDASVYVSSYDKDSTYNTPVYIDAPPQGATRLRIEDIDAFSPEAVSPRILELEEIPAYDREQNDLRGDAAALSAAFPETEDGSRPVVSLVGYYLYSPVPPLYTVLSVLMIVSVPVVFLACFFATSRAFYRAKLEKPIKTMDDAAKRIASGDLDFKLAAREAGSKDELDALCASFETMRSELDSANRAMWHAAENRRRVNAAFAHDLRTPLTVLKGRAEMLGLLAERDSLDPAFAKEAAEAMTRQVNRLERYVDSMRDLSALDEYRLDAHPVALGPWFELISKEAAVYASDAGLSFEASSEGLRGRIAVIDESAVSRIVENAVANACRYASSRVTLACSLAEGELVLRVADDGPGFGREALSHACDPFWRDKARGSDAVRDAGEGGQGASSPGAYRDVRPDQMSADDAPHHFGLGLNICATLAAKHGGGVALSNAPEGGAVVEARVSAPPV